MGTRGHGRLLAEALEVVVDVGVRAVDHVLVPERGGPDACPMRAISALRLVPLAAATVAAVCLNWFFPSRDREDLFARHRVDFDGLTECLLA